MKIGMIALTAALLMFALPAWAGPVDPCGTATLADADSDTVCDALDNCSALTGGVGPTCDTDQDGYGNQCDGDFDQSNSVIPSDFTDYFLPDFLAATDSGVGTDMDCSGAVIPSDFTDYFLPQYLSAFPGPSGLWCAGTPNC
jgi:hypothetical protein